MNRLNRRSFLLAALATTILPIKLPVGAQTSFEPFSFAFVSDVHLTHTLPDSYLLTNESQLFLQDVVQKLNQQKLDFVIFGGDQIQGLGASEENWQLFLDVAQGLNAPWSFVLGDCDVSGGDAPLDKMRSFGPDWRGHGIETSKPYWSLSPLPSVHLVGLDTSYPNSTTGFVDAEQLAWLKGDLQANSDKFTIVVSHHPLLAPPPYVPSELAANQALKSFLLSNESEVRETVLSAANVRLALSGHLYVNQVVQQGSLWYVSSPGLSIYPCAYKIFHVTPAEITMETHQVAFPALIKKGQDSIAMCPQASGAFAHRKSFISFAKGEDMSWSSSLPLGMKAEAPRVKKKEKHANG